MIGVADSSAAEQGVADDGSQDEQHDAGSSDGGAQISSVTVALRPVFTARFNSCLCDLHISIRQSMYCRCQCISMFASISASV